MVVMGLTRFGLVKKVASGAEKKFYTIRFTYDDYKFNNLDGYEMGVAVASLQGLVNKNRPRLYLDRPVMSAYSADYEKMGIELNTFWLENLKRVGGELDGYTQININNVDDLWDVFGEIRKVVVWDSRVGATANVATTIAGIEGAIPVVYGSNLYKKLVEDKNYEVAIDLHQLNFSDVSRIPGSSTVSTGSSKGNAYIWAKENYLDNNKCNSLILGYVEDGPQIDHISDQVTIRDILVKEKAFVFDLSPIGDEKPDDDPNQPMGTDRSVFIKILQSANRNIDKDREIVTVIGYPPWFSKYTSYRNPSSNYGPVQLERTSIRLMSNHGVGLLPAGVTYNTSFHNLFAKENGYGSIWRDRATKISLENKTYVMYYKGDYDGLNAKGSIYYSWGDKSRGSIKLAWGLTPMAIKYFPDVVDFLRRTSTSNDSLIGPNSGCLYIRPDEWPENRWESYGIFCNKWYERSDYSLTGFILGGDESLADKTGREAYLRAFFNFSGDGMALKSNSRQFGDDFMYTRHQGMPVIAMTDTVNDVDNAVEHIMITKIKGGFLGNTSTIGKEPKFLAIRKGPKTTPSWFVEFDQKLKQRFANEGWGQIVVVDSDNFFRLARRDLGDNNPVKYRASYAVSGMKQCLEKGEEIDIGVKMRNNGEDVWYMDGDSRAGDNPYRLWAYLTDRDGVQASSGSVPGRIKLSKNISTREKEDLIVGLKAPTAEGEYVLEIDMLKELVTKFKDQGNPHIDMDFEVKENCGSDDCGMMDGVMDIGVGFEWYRNYKQNNYSEEVDFNCDESVNISDGLVWYQGYKH